MNQPPTFLRFVSLILLSFGLLAPQHAAGAGPAANKQLFIPIALVPASASAAEQQVLELINQARRANGCNNDLVFAVRLNASADRHSSDMALRDFFSHTGSDGSSAGVRAEQAGYSYSELAENIAAGYNTPQKVVNAWMGSSGHRQNILNCELSETGIGHYYQADDQANVKDDFDQVGGPYFHYWTQDFAIPE